jgi:anti-sigma regulatory factor (Ser/Thr protein kinase)
MSHHRFTRLDQAIDEVHALFDAWAESGALATALDEDGASVLRLAVHEWVANLVQHAAFPAGAEVTLDVDVAGDAVRCVVEDTSVGFDFAGQVEQQHAIFNAPAPSERGRGLLMLITCTEDLSFRPATADSRQRISFSVRAGSGAALFAPLFRPEDLTDDFSLADTLPDGGAAWCGVEAFGEDPLGDAPLGAPFSGNPFAPPAGDGAAHGAVGPSPPALRSGPPGEPGPGSPGGLTRPAPDSP